MTDTDEVNLSVPYSSQWDPDASETRDDCGPTAIKMILNYFERKEAFTTNQIFEKTGAAKDALISVQQMLNAISKCGYEASYYTGQTIQQLKGYLDSGLPVIALVHYGAFTSRQDKGFSGGHFFTVVGYRSNGYFVNDPDFWGQYRQDGDHHFYLNADFEKGWSTCTQYDKNPNNSFIVIRRKQEVDVVDYKTLYNKCRVERDDNDRDRKALFEELGGTPGTFDKTWAITEIQQLKKQAAESGNKDQTIKELRDELAEVKQKLTEAQDEIKKIKEASDTTSTEADTIKNKVDDGLQQVEKIEKKVEDAVINEKQPNIIDLILEWLSKWKIGR